jgi:hypothetical protein
MEVNSSENNATVPFRYRPYEKVCSNLLYLLRIK